MGILWPASARWLSKNVEPTGAVAPQSSRAPSFQGPAGQTPHKVHPDSGKMSENGVDPHGNIIWKMRINQWMEWGSLFSDPIWRPRKFWEATSGLHESPHHQPPRKEVKCHSLSIFNGQTCPEKNTLHPTHQWTSILSYLYRWFSNCHGSPNPTIPLSPTTGLSRVAFTLLRLRRHRRVRRGRRGLRRSRLRRVHLRLAELHAGGFEVLGPWAAFMAALAISLVNIALWHSVVYGRY